MAPKKDQAVEKVQSEQGLMTEEDAAELMKYSGAGTEGLGSDDVRPPRLALAQAGSPQVKRGDPKEIEGLRECDMFNDLTGQSYGQGPVRVVVVTCLGPRHIEFAPMESGGGIIDGNVRANDPRTQFTVDPKDPTKRIKPIATKFYDYLVWLPEYQELMAFSMKGSQLKVASRLNSLAKYPLKIGTQMVMNPPAWARTFSIGAVMEKDDKYSWANFTLKLEGLTDRETRALAAQLHETYSKKNIVIDRDNDKTPDEDDDTLANDM